MSFVLFSEGNYIDTVTAHDLQVIDYAHFEQNASNNVNANSFEDPCKVDECPAGPSALAAPLVGTLDSDQESCIMMEVHVG